ncbi:MAG: formate hydrogenlyase [Zetaproteobacteria bacterium CG06_land_8_20_14_3_00_59_53]|nr:MAG: formate hydrogenlyase [Zetaproteobacteria bacterium CG1_02_55_237]OIQ01371.1 MAG: formate hydrogenlyase [Zetaproteobacteria bacterium CG2_30_59_37]PIO89724.1 MAG: formate hydrogenlyase [Zetaproteobacteria bacterium CG23_combo_of_CG06-09_8_20_14_all_59_86]PIU70137.1 MAG: formate hydrogenlyase [Zetaproteobacteria bacterium CG06_land_8_20_14_3_00_59_53]PIW43218.1 MAG: formate hydrogenlyase [Zetaproteobacteria bacterium CG12_big_fil_rev_8_21_14_0_65_55_1124]PIZ39669.1 MAG: formate hydrogen
MSAALIQQLVDGLAALMLLTSFALLAQHRMLSVLNWFAAQGVLLAVTAAVVAYGTDNNELYISAVMTFLLKGLLLPWLLWRVIRELHVHREVEPLMNTTLTMLVALGVTLFAFHIIQPIEKISQLMTRDSMAIATACVLLGMLMMITRRKAITQVVGFLAVENSLFFAAIGSTNGMPLVVEIGIAFDVLIAALIFGLFFFQIRDTFDSLEVDAMNAHLIHGDDEE